MKISAMNGAVQLKCPELQKHMEQGSAAMGRSKYAALHCSVVINYTAMLSVKQNKCNAKQQSMPAQCGAMSGNRRVQYHTTVNDSYGKRQLRFHPGIRCKAKDVT